MRLVVKYTVTDDCTYWATETAPVVYASAEAFLVGFEEALNKALTEGVSCFIFANRSWEVDDHSYYDAMKKKNVPNLPHILTLDEWYGKKESIVPELFSG